MVLPTETGLQLFCLLVSVHDKECIFQASDLSRLVEVEVGVPGLKR